MQPYEIIVAHIVAKTYTKQIKRNTVCVLATLQMKV